jgi:phosphoribosyl 1,2-cyclic phosphodiesterase
MGISHQDHCCAANDIIRQGIPVYLNEATAESQELSGVHVHIFKEKQFGIGTLIIKPFPLVHDAPNTGFIIYSRKTGRKLVYITDTHYCRFRVPGMTHLMIECNYATDILEENIKAGRIDPSMRMRLLNSHMSLENVKKFLQANDLSKTENLYLIHLSAKNSDEERFKREIQAITGKETYIARTREDSNWTNTKDTKKYAMS